MYSSLGFVTVPVVLQTQFSEFGMWCVANVQVWDMLCMQTFGMCCVADGQWVCIDRFLRSGFPVQTFSTKYKKWYVLVGINMYCVCFGMYPYVFYGAQA